MMHVFTCILMLNLLFPMVSGRKLYGLRGLPLLLFQNSTLDNSKGVWSLYVNGERDDTHIANWKVNSSAVEELFKYSENIYIDEYRNIWIRAVSQNDVGKYTMKYNSNVTNIVDISYGPEVEVVLAETSYHTTATLERLKSTEETSYHTTTTLERLKFTEGTCISLIIALLVIVVFIGAVGAVIYTRHQRKKKTENIEEEEIVPFFDVPQTVQVTSHRESPNPASYLLMWNKQDDVGSPLLRYHLRYQEVEIIPNKPEYELSRPLSEFIFVDNIPSSDDRYQLEQLNCGRYYQVVIQAVNNQGQSLPQSFIFKTREGVPQPVQVTSHRDSLNSTSYLLTWNEPADKGSLPQKYIIKYQNVEIIPGRTEYELSSPLSNFIYVDNILPSEISYRLEPLMGGKYYQVEIQAVNTEGQSLPQSFIFKTKEGVPEQVHVKSQCDSPNPTSHQLMWDKPDDGGSLIQKYIIRHREVESIPNKSEYELSRPLGDFTSVDIIPSAVSHRLSELMSGRYYQVEIEAVNIHGPSSPKSFIFKTKESVPQAIQVTSHRDSPNPNSYLLTWNKPDDGGSQLQKYFVRYQEVEIIPNRKEYELSRPLSEFISTKTIPSSDVSCRLAPLVPGRHYQVEIQAINTQGQSTPQSFIFKTSIQKQEDKEVQTDSQWPDSTPTQVSDGTNYQLSTGVKSSERNKPLQPRVKNIPTADKETMQASSHWEMENNKWQKQRVGKDKLDADEDSDDGSVDISRKPLLEESGQKA